MNALRRHAAIQPPYREGDPDAPDEEEGDSDDYEDEL